MGMLIDHALLGRLQAADLFQPPYAMK